MTERLKTLYQSTLVPNLMQQMGYANAYETPKLSKIVVNQGLGEALQNSKVLDTGLTELRTITGQKGVVTKSRKPIASFKLRAKVPVGISVILRGPKMYAFLDRLIHLSLPRIRDFRGINPKSFDGCGNYSFGLEEQLMFPEIEYDKIDQIRGMDICIVTTAKNDKEGLCLLKALGLPLRDSA